MKSMFSLEELEKRRQKMLGDKNPMKKKEISEKVSNKLKGKHNSLKTEFKKRDERITGKNNHNWKGGPVAIECIICRKFFEVERCKCKISKFCSYKCYWKDSAKKHRSPQTEFKKGDKSPNWKGGISPTPYNSGWTKELRGLVRKIDNYRCRRCNQTQEQELKERSRKLAVHHVDYDKNFSNLFNLITLCLNCHMKTNFNRGYWKKYYQNKIRIFDRWIQNPI